MLPNSCAIPSLKHPQDYQAYRISPDDTNRLAIVFDPIRDRVSFTCCIEIYDPYGKTPPNRHQYAVEMFFILQGRGQASCDGKVVEFQTGDTLLVPATGEHIIENTTAERLYAMCIMVPNEDFAELIRSGQPVALDAEDFQVLQRVSRQLVAPTSVTE
ncbi:MAG: cupin domain-containing protein [Synechococcus sp.]